MILDLSIDKFGLHQMVNPNASETAVSLHLYSPPIPACKIFDPSNGACKLISSAKIDSKEGIRLVSPTSDQPAHAALTLTKN